MVYILLNILLLAPATPRILFLVFGWFFVGHPPVNPPVNHRNIQLIYQWKREGCLLSPSDRIELDEMIDEEIAKADAPLPESFSPHQRLRRWWRRDRTRPSASTHDPMEPFA